MKLKDKSAIITGAGGGIGRATALRLARDGANMVLVDFNEDTLNETVGMAQNEGAQAYPVVADVSKAEDVQRYVDTAEQRLGRIDLFHNNAGVLQAPGMLHEAEEAEFDKVISVNLKGAFLGLKYVLAEMAQQGSGAIVNGASHAAIRAEPMLGMYAATKHALAGLTLTGAAEYGPKGIRVNAVCPGAVKTPMTAGTEESQDPSGFGPMHRMACPEEIAATVAFLFSEDASYVNGVLMPVDGGLAV